VPQPTVQQVHVNRPLTNISVAYIQDQNDFIASKVFPIVPVDKKSDMYFTYSQNDFMRDEAAKRADGDESVGSGYGLSEQTYNADVWSFHKDVGNQVRENSDQPLDPDRDATTYVTRKLLLKQETQFASNYFTTGVWGTDVVGGTASPKWSDYAGSDPITDIETGKDNVQGVTGYMPNKLVLGYTLFRYLKQHPDIVDRIKYTSPNVPTEQILAQLFGLDEVVVAKAIKATNNEGETAAYTRVHGNNALLCYTPAQAGILQPAAGYIFGWKGISGGMGTNIAISSFYMPWRKSTRVEGESAFAMQMVGANLGYFFSNYA